MTAPRFSGFAKFRASIAKRYNRLCHSGYSVEKAYGRKFLIDWEHPVDKKLAYQRFEHDRIEYFLNQVTALKPDHFLDIGAHSGLYSILVDSRLPSIQIHAFEPDPTNRGQLHANLFLNRLNSRVEVHPFGLSDSQQTLHFAASTEQRHRAFSKISETGKVTVEVRRLDDVMLPENQTIAIKIDVEGHELPALRGAEQVLRRNACFLQIESSDTNFPEVKSYLEALGYDWITSMGDHYFSNMPKTATSASATSASATSA